MNNDPTLKELSPYMRPSTSRGILPWMKDAYVPLSASSLYKLRSGIEIEQRSERLAFDESAYEYFKEMEHTSSEHLRFITRFEGDITQELSNVPEVSVAITVASDQEGDNLYTTLEQYALQSPSVPFEVILFLNKVKGVGDSTATLNALHLFKKEYPDFPVAAFDYEFSEQMPLGYIKKVLHDTVALRHFRANSQNPTILLSDSDVHRTHPHYTMHMLNALDDTSIDIVAGHLDWDNDAFLRFPELHFTTRLHQLVDHAIYNKAGEMITSGTATAMRLSTYCEIGGTPPVGRGEDVMHGLTIQARRGNAASIVRPHADAIVETSARRTVAALKQGFAPNETWRFRSDENDRAMRLAYKANSLSENDPFGDGLEERMRLLARRVLGVYSTELHSELFMYAFNELGVSAKIDRTKEGVAIDDFDASAAIAAMQAYRNLK